MALLPFKPSKFIQQHISYFVTQGAGLWRFVIPLGSERALTLHQLQPDAADTVVAKPAWLLPS